MTFTVSTCPKLRVVLPVALTQLYFTGGKLWPAGYEHDLSYSCSFSDAPKSTSKLKPDLIISLVAVPTGFRALEEDKISVKRRIVASIKLIGNAPISRPRDIEQFPYATLSRSDCRYFYLTTPGGETMVIDPKTIFRSNDLFAAHEAARLGIAFAVLPEWMVLDDLNNGSLISLLSDWPPQSHVIRITISKKCTRPEKAEILKKIMLEKLKNIPGIEVQ